MMRKAVAAAALSIAAGLLGGCAATVAQTAPASVPPAAFKPTAGEQWLFGSAEAQIASRQVWQDIAAFGSAVARSRPVFSAYLEPQSKPGDIRFEPCGDKPLAAVFDADETLIWNLGITRYQSERGESYDPALWAKWEATGAGKAVALPGAIKAVDALRAAGITVIVNTNRSREYAQGTEATLAAAGLGNFEHGKTLFLHGDFPEGGRKDARRAHIAKTYCIVLLAGDQLGDISDIFNEASPFYDHKPTVAERRALATRPAFDGIWGNGWFILPNPIYGPSVTGGFADIYPADTGWTPDTAQPDSAQGIGQ